MVWIAAKFAVVTIDKYLSRWNFLSVKITGLSFIWFQNISAVVESHISNYIGFIHQKLIKLMKLFVFVFYSLHENDNILFLSLFSISSVICWNCWNIPLVETTLPFIQGSLPMISFDLIRKITISKRFLSLLLLAFLWFSYFFPLMI